ncbi:proline-rich protein 5-like isoform X1 [Struthio camelus]|uniref:proline-rich protein 5-like isoform X1 n=1 Tax=Struthio camelus TaxID=8801 RepID=UPI003604013A
MTGGFTVAPSFALQLHKMGSFRRPRPRFMSSPVLSDLPRFQATRQALQLSSNSAWNSVQTAVINVFKGGGLQNNELYTLNENIRRLLKSELGSFITDYFQNQLLAKGLLFIEEKVKLCEGEDRIDILSEIWDHYFTETLPTLQAIFYPVQGQELTIRQIALLGFRDLVLLKVKLEEILPLVQAKLPASIVQMLLILQVGRFFFSLSDSTWDSCTHLIDRNPGKESVKGKGRDEEEFLCARLGTLNIEMRAELPLKRSELSWQQSVHEPTGPSEGYLQLEELVKQVISPYLGMCEDHSFSGSTCLLERRYSRSRPKTGILNYSSQMVTSRQPSEMALTPLTEQEGEAYLEKCGSIRRHTVANAHSDIQLLAMASMMHTGMVIEESDSNDKCLLLQSSFSHRQCSSEPSIADGPEGVMAAGRQDPAELNCTSVS